MNPFRMSVSDCSAKILAKKVIHESTVAVVNSSEGIIGKVEGKMHVKQEILTLERRKSKQNIRKIVNYRCMIIFSGNFDWND